MATPVVIVPSGGLPVINTPNATPMTVAANGFGVPITLVDKYGTPATVEGGGPAPSFSPSDLFTAGVKGAWYDPSDLSSLFQDAAGTIPVTADGQTVGRISDKSGNGMHLKRAVGSSAALYRPNVGGMPYVEIASTSGAQVWFDSGGSTFPYDSQTQNIYLGARTENAASQTTVQFMAGYPGDPRSYGIRFQRTADQINVIYSGDEENIDKFTNRAPSLPSAYSDSYLTSFATSTRPFSSFDLLVNDAAGGVTNGADSGAGRVNLGLSTFINTLTNAAGIYPVNMKWFGGIVVVGSVTNADRTNCFNYFDNPR